MTPDQKDLLAELGGTLLMIQTTERVLRLCMTFVLPKASPVTLELLRAQEKAERKSTLGYFLGELRKRVDVDPQLDRLLDEFLERRNMLVHRFSDVDGYSYETGPGIAAGRAFIHETLRSTETVLMIFIGLVRAWQEQVGMDVGHIEKHPYFEEIDATYKNLAADLFFKKAD